MDMSVIDSSLVATLGAEDMLYDNKSKVALLGAENCLKNVVAPDGAEDAVDDERKCIRCAACSDLSVVGFAVDAYGETCRRCRRDCAICGDCDIGD